MAQSRRANSWRIWRGVSQSDESLAFQSGLTYTSPVGVYATAQLVRLRTVAGQYHVKCEKTCPGVRPGATGGRAE